MIVNFALFIFGAAIGSFLNVVALRYSPGQKLLDLKIIGGRSHCFICHKTLAWYELIPIFSFIIQKGKCRHCGRSISFQYPLIEILSGLIFVFVPYTLFSILNPLVLFGTSPQPLIFIAVWLLIFLLFLLLSIIDFRHYVIPDQINLFLAILGGLLVIASGEKQFHDQSLILGSQFSFLGHYALLFDFWPLSAVSDQWSVAANHLSAAIIAMIFFGMIILLTKGKAMGLGDLKLVGPLGLIFGWPDILMVLFLSFIVGAVFSVALLIKKIKKMKDAVPFGPFLIAGASLTFFFGYQIISGYFRLFSL